MGGISIFTREQKIILDEVRKNLFLKDQFYFTGGTALSAIYLKHRESDDLDFFSEKKIDEKIIFTLITDWGKKHNFKIQSRFVDVVYIFNLVFPDQAELKVDFSYYPYKRLEKGQIIDGLLVDSLLDIATNKLLVTSQRTEIKDFVDLYFLLQKFTFWDLLEGVKIKFDIKLEPFLISADFLKVEEFDYLPKMIEPIDLSDLKLFFREKAREIGKKSVE